MSLLVINRRRKLGLKLETVYFADNYREHVTDADIVLFYLTPAAVKGARQFTTMRFDLRKSEEALFNGLNKSTRRAVRKAEASGEYSILFDKSPSEAALADFCRSYDSFASEIGIRLCDRELLEMAAAEASLCIYRLQDKEGSDLCGGADIHDGKTVLCMYAYSHFRKYSDRDFRNRIAEANRYAYWKELLHYKERGFAVLDMGGMGMGHEESALDSVDSFKLGFGGSIETLYHFYMAYTPAGKLILWLTNRNKAIEY